MFRNFDIKNIIYSLPAIFLAFSFHEYAHAYTANKLGDSTPKNQGRLTLDPLAHVDWIGLLMFSIFGFGWAKPVEINSKNFKNRKTGEILVALSGPLANLFISIISLILIYLYNLLLIRKINTTSLVYSSVILTIMQKIAFLNLVFTFLNLVPIPPFDGYKIIKNLFFRKNYNFFWQLERYSMFILFAFILLNIFDYIVAIPSYYTYSLIERSIIRLGSFLF